MRNRLSAPLNDINKDTQMKQGGDFQPRKRCSTPNGSDRWISTDGLCPDSLTCQRRVRSVMFTGGIIAGKVKAMCQAKDGGYEILDIH